MFRDSSHNKTTISCFELLQKYHPATTEQETEYRNLLFKRLWYHYHIYAENFTNEKLNVIMQAACLAEVYTDNRWASVITTENDHYRQLMRHNNGQYKELSEEDRDILCLYKLCKLSSQWDSEQDKDNIAFDDATRFLKKVESIPQYSNLTQEIHSSIIRKLARDYFKIKN